ncbi:MAG: phosphate ABC transporter permease PstA [Alkalinema sp. FL-bin-369]|nr:phosphate ABC transporter permease PstA [Leptolyngbyaceae cyanobacterium LF-bin-369]
MTFSLNQIQTSVVQRQRWSNVFAAIAVMAIVIAFFILVALFGQLLWQGMPKLNWQFLTSFADPEASLAGIFAAWVGSFLVMLVTAAIAVPVGIAAGLYLEEYAPKNWFSDLIEINVTNLAGVPSIVYGLLALGLFKYYLNLGESILTAGLTLALLVLPVVIVNTREAVKAIPGTLREAAYAIGASKSQMVFDHLLPYSFGNILTGVIIGLSRAIGETAPLVTIGALTFIAFLPDSPFQSTFPFISFAWLKAPFTVMPIQMFSWVSRPEPEFQVNAAAAGVVLLGMTLVMNAITIYLRYRLQKNLKW